MENTIQIKQITFFSSEVFDVIRNLAQQEGKNYKTLTDEDAREMLESPNTYIFAAWDTNIDMVVGMATLLVHRIPYVKKAVMEDIVVDEAARGKGIATMLVSALLERAKKEGAAYIDGTARIRRESSNNLYEKLGFRKREANIYRHIFDYGEV